MLRLTAVAGIYFKVLQSMGTVLLTMHCSCWHFENCEHLSDDSIWQTSKNYPPFFFSSCLIETSRWLSAGFWRDKHNRNIRKKRWDVFHEEYAKISLDWKERCYYKTPLRQRWNSSGLWGEEWICMEKYYLRVKVNYFYCFVTKAAKEVLIANTWVHNACNLSALFRSNLVSPELKLLVSTR